MRYPIAAVLVMVPTIIVLLSAFHLLILPYVGPHGFVPMMAATAILGLSAGTAAEKLIDRTYCYLQRRFP